LYRYYVCTTAQKQGPDACQTRSLPAQEIEDFIIEQIRRLANDPDLIDQVFEQAAKQQRAKILRLRAEQKRLQKERQHKNERIKELVAAIGSSEEPLGSLTESLRELESMITRIDQRLAEIRDELASIERAKINKDDLAAGLSSFVPVWDKLYPAEKTRVVNLLIERVEFDVRWSRIHISLRSFGLESLADA